MSQLFKSEGIVFKSLDYSETSIILDIYTRDEGLLSFIVSGVRKSGARKSNVYHPMNIIDVVAYKNEDRLSRIKEAELAYTYTQLYGSVIRSSLGMYIVDLSRNAIREKEAHLEVYELIRSYLVDIDQDRLPLRHTAIRFSLDLASYLGFQFQDNHSQQKPYFDLASGTFTETPSGAHVLGEDQSRLLSIYLKGGKPEDASRQQRNLLLDNLILFYKLHVEGFRSLKSLDVIRTILS